jgi:cellulose synthase/poly-beta-1,6-N-acetylglucosamine synthase-like glycosyltransferase
VVKRRQILHSDGLVILESALPVARSILLTPTGDWRSIASFRIRHVRFAPVPSPLISIITASLNRAPMLAQAIESVERQGFDDYEHIIVDGCSTDGTTDLLAQHPRLKVIREPDRNVYDALNKGLRAATGSIVVLLNSDDLLAPGALAAGARALARRTVRNRGGNC